MGIGEAKKSETSFFSNHKKESNMVENKIKYHNLIPKITLYIETIQYSSNQITKKEPKSDDRLSKFDWHDLSSTFLAIMLFYNLKTYFRNQ